MKKVLLSVLFAAAGALQAQAPAPQTRWVTSWTSAQLKVTPPPVFSGATQAPTPAEQAIRGFRDQSLRMVIPTTIGGTAARVEISNVFGERPLMVGAANIAIRESESVIRSGTARDLTFGGKKAFMVPPGASLLTDPIALTVPQFSDLAVSIYLPGETGVPTTHQVGLHTTYIGPKGDWTTRPNFEGAGTSVAWYFLSALHVMAPANASTLVTLGDSITDGAVSTPNTDRSWPSVLARRLSKNGVARVGVANQGISGNRVLRDGSGPNALARFDRDVLGVNGVKWLMILEGINDIGRATGPGSNPADAATAEEIIAGHKQLIDRAHMHGLKVIGATLTPFEGAPYYSETGETMRQAVNQWIRTGGAYDAVVDFEAVMSNPASPKRLRPEFDPGDHLHPNDAGYKAMADAVNLALFD